MDIFRQKKLLLWTIALLLVLNVASLGMLWYQSSLRPVVAPGQRPLGPGAVVRLAERELNLSDKQKERFDQLRKEHFMQASSIQDDINKAKRAILEEVTAPVPDTAKVNRLTHDIGENQGRFERFLFDHFLAMRLVLTPEQMQKYDQVLHDVTEASRPAGPRGLFPDTQGGPPPDDSPEGGPRPDNLREPRERN
jgi:Spy/CpxP family protein refolding chaperone